jgi:hypothetical protein
MSSDWSVNCFLRGSAGKSESQQLQLRSIEQMNAGHAVSSSSTCERDHILHMDVTNFRVAEASFRRQPPAHLSEPISPPTNVPSCPQWRKKPGSKQESSLSPCPAIRDMMTT